MEKIIEFKNSFIKAYEYKHDRLRVRFLHEEINI